MEIYVGITSPNQQVQFTVIPGIVNRCKFPRGSQENIENYINEMKYILLYLYNVKIIFKTMKI